MATKKAIVIIGGGSAGHSTAKALSDALNPDAFTIQLVNPRPFSIHYPAMLRAASTSEGNIEQRALIPYDKLFAPGKAGELVVGMVDNISDGVVTLKDGQTLPYDWLVLASGTKWEGPLDLPFTEPEAVAWLNDWRTKIAGAHDVVLGGGGAIGIELAGEIKHFYPHINVTIVHAGQGLLNDTYPAKFRNAALKAVKQVGVNVVLDDKIEIPQGAYSSVTTSKGLDIKADLVIPTRGGRPNTSFIRSFDPSIITEKGTIRVQPTLQVPLANGKTNVFALGDIIEWSEQKQLAKIPSHSAVVAANIVNAANGKQGSKTYGGFMEGILLPLGPNGGTGYIPMLWGFILGNWAAKTIKSKGLFVDMARKGLNYT